MLQKVFLEFTHMKNNKRDIILLKTYWATQWNSSFFNYHFICM